MNMIKKWFRKINPRLSVDEARDMLSQGASLVDVRTAKEYARSHADKAINIPIDTLKQRMSELPAGVLILHCQSGVRSQMAVKKIKATGRSDIYNLGGLAKALQL